MGLKNTSDDLMYTTRRKTGFIGFMVAIESMKGIFAELVERKEAPMKYILTYKFSKDHLELFFGAIRSSGGFNNNPTAQQFTAAYKRLLLRSSVHWQNGNCHKQDETSMLEVIGDTVATKDHHQVTINDAAIIRKYDLQGNSQQHDDDYSDAPTISTISQFKKATISYIAGYVVGMVQKKMICSTCCAALGSRQHKAESSFLSLKDRGNLLKPTASVINVCLETEKCFQRFLLSTDGKLPQSKGLPSAIASTVLSEIDMANTFQDLDEHMLDTTVDDNHLFKLIKSISESYSKVRLYQLGKTAMEVSKNKVRKKLNKLVLFNHQ